MNDSVWDMVLAELAKRMNPQDFDVWFSDCRLLSASRERLIIEVGSGKVRDFINDHYKAVLLDIIEHLVGIRVSMDIVARGADQSLDGSGNAADHAILSFREQDLYDSSLNERFDFDNFIVGKSNEIAYTASVSVSSSPGMLFNPLFIWGGVGLGKTHLLQSICHRIRREKPYLKVLYIHSEQFIDEIVSAIRSGDTSHFKMKYRFVDILAIDDIQFIQGANVTQIEFFHTFNTLYESRKQIVVSSDRPPKSLNRLTDRIRTRFEWGLITKIDVPDLETRIKIIKRKAEDEDLILSNEIIAYIAGNIKNNIRAIEGALVTLKFHKDRIRDENISSILTDYLERKEDTSPVTMDGIKRAVSEYFHVSENELSSKSRVARLIVPRFIAIYLATKYTKLTTKEIGYHFGGRDHSTIINARKEIENKLEKDENIRDSVRKIENRLIA